METVEKPEESTSLSMPDQLLCQRIQLLTRQQRMSDNAKIRLLIQLRQLPPAGNAKPADKIDPPQ